jgi:glycogen operon protein
MQEYKSLKGRPYPLGSSFDKKGGLNFAVLSKNSQGVTLEFYKLNDLGSPFISFELNPKKNKTGDVWHIHIIGLDFSVLCYAYRFSGEYSPEKTGDRFNRNKLLIDPYARALVSSDNRWHFDAAYGYDKAQTKDVDMYPSPVDNSGPGMKCVLVDDSHYDWQDDHHPRIPLNKTIIYETHARGTTMHPSARVASRGTFAGIAEKIPYFRELGITAIEFLPVHEFNEDEIIRVNPKTGERLKNYWGYNSLSFFALNSLYSSSKEPGGVVAEFKDMVRQLHRADIEVILDVVYNHTGEGNEVGPSVAFRGIDNRLYYHLDNNRFYKNYSGCGNTLNCNHSAVKQMILDSLRYFVSEMHVDGFRFDLAAILGRDASGAWIGVNSLLRDIEEDPVLAGTKLIAEGWDAAGCYKVGEFPPGWAEWNGKFRDDIRSFMKGDDGCVSALATRICGSPDLYGNGRAPYHSINFITSHDGFTLRDLVTYNNKNNFENGEYNADGTDDNRSYNYGAEGETGDIEINRTRIRQVKNFVTLLMISQGTPMILGGDEFYRTQRGNNNCYCQDNKLSWFDWDFIEKYREVFDYFKKIIAFRRENPIFCLETFLNKSDAHNPEISAKFIDWHGVKLNQPDWSHISHSLAFTVNGLSKITSIKNYDKRFYIAINAFLQPLIFELPPARPKMHWRLKADTFEKSGKDIFADDEMPARVESTIKVRPRSIVILAEK